MAQFQSAEAAAVDRTTIVGLSFLLFICIFLQRLALPVGSSQVSFAFVAGYAVFGALLLLGRLVIHPLLLVLFLASMTAATLSFVVSATAASLTSYVYLLAIYLLYIVKLRFREGSLVPVLDAYQAMMALAACLGLAQFGAQFVIGPDLAFPLDNFLPEELILQGFNVMVPLAYGTPVLRSNGILFLEPSFFSQFLGLAIVIELQLRQRPFHLALYGAALLVSYSGTGIAIVALFVPWILLRRGSVALVAWLIVAGIIVLLAASALQLELLTSRVGEFSAPESSGFARFISPFLLVRDFLLDSPASLLFGLGAGSVEDIMRRASQHAYLAHDPTWVKLLFEYGAITTVLLFTYVFLALLRDARDRMIALAIALTYLFLGGYLLNGMMHLMFVALAAWHNLPAPAKRPARRTEPDYPWPETTTWSEEPLRARRQSSRASS